MRLSTPARLTLRTAALLYVGVLVVLPVGTIVVRTLAPGLPAFWASISTPAAISALNLTLLILAIVVPLNVVFGTLTALLLVRGSFRGKAVIQALLDLPFAVSPVVVGVSLIALWGVNGWFGFLPRNGVPIIFAVPGMVLATAFVTVPFVVREVEPVLRELGDSQEQAAATLGASPLQTLWRITLPSIRWGLLYGTLLTISRGLGEYGAVLLVSSNLPGISQTLTLLVHARYVDSGNTYGALAVATLLMGLSILTLVGTALLDRNRRSRA